MKSNQRHTLLKRQTGAVVLPRAPRFDGPIATELRDAIRRMRAELRRSLERVRIYRQLTAIEREADRAERELAWTRDELEKQEINWTQLQYVHKRDRDALVARLQQLSEGGK
ncbi:hypothetical protein DFLDMN_001039 [Cupriavidus sp. H19C3]|uniref:hypothetical protein n=1 Tax=Cupriavidus sp. H19C3 TaxID=3241603 RepID=UPI003BF7DBBF